MPDQSMTMQTNILQQRHPKIYEDFFQQHNIVISAANVFNRGHGVGETFNHFKLKQKVPTKTYLGLNKLKEKTVKIDFVYEYDGISSDFVREHYDNVVTHVDLLEQYLTDRLQGQ